MTLPRLFIGNQIRLNDLDEQDLEPMKAWYADSTFSRLYDSAPAHPMSIAKLKEQFESQQNAVDAYYFAIRPLDKNKLIGIVSLSDIEWHNGNGWLAIAIGDQANQGKGYGKEATGLVLDFAFLELNLRRIQLTVFDYNLSAIALYEKLGFQHEGSFREFGVRNNTPYNMLLYGLLRREWFAQFPDGFSTTLD